MALNPLDTMSSVQLANAWLVTGIRSMDISQISKKTTLTSTRKDNSGDRPIFPGLFLSWTDHESNEEDSSSVSKSHRFRVIALICFRA